MLARSLAAGVTQAMSQLAAKIGAAGGRAFRCANAQAGREFAGVQTAGGPRRLGEMVSNGTGGATIRYPPYVE